MPTPLEQLKEEIIRVLTKVHCSKSEARFLLDKYAEAYHSQKLQEVDETMKRLG